MQGAATHFAKGTYVLLAYPDGGSFKVGPPNKLMTQLGGPHIVESNVGSDYVLRNQATGKEVRAHVTRLSEFRYDKQRTNPLEIAVKDSGSFIVESVTGHRGYTGTGADNRVSELELYVKWFGDLSPSWQPWKNFHTNAVAHAYMNQIPHLKKVLNLAYRDPVPAHLQPVPRAPQRPQVVQAPPPDIIVENGVMKRNIDVGADQPTALTRNAVKRARPAGGGP